jgi:hypothetical protein
VAWEGGPCIHLYWGKTQTTRKKLHDFLNRQVS